MQIFLTQFNATVPLLKTIPPLDNDDDDNEDNLD